MASTSTPSVIEPTRPYYSPHRKAKAKGTNRKKLVSSDICHVALASVLLGENRLKKMIMIIIIIISMNKSQELTVFPGRQKLTSTKN